MSMARVFSRIGLSLALVAGAGFCVGMTGCQTKVPPTKKSGEHDHAHDHSHEEGKHGGHLADLEPMGAHVEWAHDDEKGTVTIYCEEIVAGGAKVEKVQIEVKVGTEEPKVYDLAGSAADEHKIEGSIFTITDPALVTAMEVEGVKSTLMVTVDGKVQKASLEHDHGHDHGHKH